VQRQQPFVKSKPKMNRKAQKGLGKVWHGFFSKRLRPQYKARSKPWYLWADYQAHLPNLSMRAFYTNPYYKSPCNCSLINYLKAECFFSTFCKHNKPLFIFVAVYEYV
jgi:hypothetical protein